MVSDVVLGAIVGGGAAVAGSLVQAYFNRKNTRDLIEAQKEQQQAQFFAGEKVQALSQLHSVLVECRTQIGNQLAGDGPVMTEHDVDTQIWPLILSLQTAQDQARIFLRDNEQQQAVHDAVVEIIKAAQFIKAATKGGVSEDPAPVEMEDLAEETEKAKGVLKRELNKPIEQFEPNS